MRVTITFIFFIILTGNTRSQIAVDSDNLTRYIRLTSDNDYFKLRGNTDRYFTNGLKLEVLFLPHVTKKGFLNKGFPTLRPATDRDNNFGVGLAMNMYTPTDIQLTLPSPNDRPYAGWLYGFVKLISNRFDSQERITTEYGIGIIGPAAGQKKVQTKWHEVINSPKPMGWDTQIPNDIALNIKVDYEKGVFFPAKNIEIIGLIEGNFGSVTNFFGLGTHLRFGIFNNYFLNGSGFSMLNSTSTATYKSSLAMSSRRNKPFQENLDNKWQLFLYAKTNFRSVIDNSLLQGGLLHHGKATHKINSDRITRFYAQNEFGINLISPWFGISFSQLFRTPEFKNALVTHWGAVSVMVKM